MHLKAFAFAWLTLIGGIGCSRPSPASDPSPQEVQPARPEGAPSLESWELGPDKWPTTCDAAALDVTQWLSPEAREKLRTTPRDDLILFHHGLGTGIRNRQGRWRGNASLIKSCLGTPGHPDEASMIIIEEAWGVLQAARRGERSG